MIGSLKARAEPPFKSRAIDSLSVEEVICILRVFNIPFNEDKVRKKPVDGKILSNIALENDWLENDVLKDSQSYIRRLSFEVRKFQENGVPIELIRPINSTPVLSHPNPVDELRNDLKFAAESSNNTTLAKRSFSQIPSLVGSDRKRHHDIGTAPGICHLAVRVLDVHLLNRDICLGGLVAIRTLCRYGDDLSTSCEQSVASLGEAGACEVVVIAVRSHMKVLRVMVEGCRAIRSLACNAVNRRKLGVAGASSILFSCLSAAESASLLDDGPLLAEAAYLSLVNLSSDEGNKDKISEALRTQSLILGIRAYVSKAHVVEAGFWAMRNVSLYDNNQTLLGQAGTCETVVGALKTHQSNASAVEAGFEAIGNLAFKSLANSILLGGAGACGVVLACLRTHILSPKIAERGCFVIKNLFIDRASRSHFGEIGGCEELTCVLQTHKSASRVVEQCCKALIGLVTANDSNRSKVTDAGAQDVLASIADEGRLTVPALLSANRALQVILFGVDSPHPIVSVADAINILKLAVSTISDAAIARRALGCIPLIIAGDEGRHRALCDSEGVASAVIHLLRAHADSEAVCMKGLAAVRVMCRFGPDRTSSCRETALQLGLAGACETVVEVVKKFAAVTNVAEQGAWAIRNLAVHPDNEVKFGEAGACALLVDLLRAHMSSGSIVDKVCSAVTNLAIGDANKHRFGEVGACELIVLVLRRHVNDGAVTEAACLSMGNISAKNNRNKLALLNLMVLDSITSVLKRHSTDAIVCERGCWAIRNLTSLGETIAKYVNTALYQAVLGVLHLHSASSAVVEQGCAAIANLAACNCSVEVVQHTDVCCTLVRILRTHSQSLSVVQQVCWAIKNLSTVPESSEHLGEVGACRLTVDLLLDASQSVPVVESVLWAIRALAVNEKNKSMLGALGACEAIVSCLKKLGKEAEVVLRGCKAMDTLLAGNEANRVKLAAVGAQGILYSICENKDAIPSNVKVVAESLLHVLNKPDGVSSDSKATVASKEVEEAANILNLLRSSQSSDTLCKTAFSALISLCGDSGLPPGLNDLLTEICEAVVLTLRCFITLPALTQQGCLAIRSLALNPMHNSLLGEIGACELVVSALRIHISNINLLKSIHSAIAVLAKQRSNRNRLVTAGVCPLVESTLTLRVYSDETMQAIFSAVNSLPFDPSHPLIEAIIMIIQRSLSCEAVVRVGIEKLLELIDFATSLPEFIGGDEALQSSPLAVVQDMGPSTHEGRLVQLVASMMSSLSAGRDVVQLSLSLMTKLMCKDVTRIATKLGEAGVLELVVQNLRNYKDSSAFANQCTHVILQLVSVDKNQVQLVNAGLVPALLSVMQEHLPYSHIVETSASVVRVLVDNDRLPSHELYAECLPALFTGLEVNPTSRSFAEEVCLTLAALIRLSKHVDLLPQHGASETLLAVVLVHSKDSGFVERSCSVLTSVISISGKCWGSWTTARQTESLQALQFMTTSESLSESARQQASRVLQTILLVEGESHDVTNADEVALALRRASRLPGRVDLANAALSGLPRLIASSYSQGRLFHLKDGLAVALVQILEANQSSESICTKGLAALALLTRTGPGSSAGSEEPVLLLFEAGVCAMLVSLLRTHVHNQDLVSVGCDIIRNLTTYPTTTKTTKKGLEHAVVYDILVRVLRLHGSVSDIADVCLAIIVSLPHTESNTYESAIVKEACEALTAVTKAHVARASLVQMSLTAISQIICNVREVVEQLGELDACAVMVEALRAHIGDTAVVEQGFCVLRSLSTLDANRRRLGDAGACVVLVIALQRHGHHFRVVELGCAIMLNLTLSERNVTLLCTAEACETVVRVLRAHARDDLVVESACGVIGAIASDCVENKRRLMDLGVEPLLKSISSSALSDVVKECIVDALGKVCCLYIAN